MKLNEKLFRLMMFEKPKHWENLDNFQKELDRLKEETRKALAAEKRWFDKVDLKERVEAYIVYFTEYEPDEDIVGCLEVYLKGGKDDRIPVNVFKAMQAILPVVGKYECVTHGNEYDGHWNEEWYDNVHIPELLKKEEELSF